MNDTWWVYLIESKSHHVYYTGITTDLQKRIDDHNVGKGAKFTKGRYPWYLVGCKKFYSRSEASKEEIRVKEMHKDKKLEWAKGSE